jgi:hypothetical protein
MPKVSEGMVALCGVAALAVWLLVALPLLYLPSHSSHKHQPHSSEPAKAANAEPKGTEAAPFFVQVIPSPKPAEERAQEAEDREEKKDADRWLVRWTFALFAATIGLILATGVLGYFAYRQADDMKASIEAAADSAKAANRSAKVAEEALVANDRAWISIKAEVIAPLVFEKDRVLIGVGFDMTNVGNSPATHVDISAELCPDIIAAQESGKKAAGLSALSMLGFGVVLFPGDVEKRNWLEMEMSAESFRQNIAVARARAAERGDDESEGSTAWPGIMVRAAYKLAGSSKIRHTIILFEVRTNFIGHRGWDGTSGKTELVYLDLVQTFMSGQVT